MAVEDYYRMLGISSSANERERFDESEPCYVISVAAKMVGVKAQTLRYYERIGVVEPSRSKGRIRLYSDKDIGRLRHIKTLTEDLGVNLAGAEIILRLIEQIAEMEKRMEAEIKKS
jgi:MerR family transcriptional regulator/heat shock protein HspR